MINCVWWVVVLLLWSLSLVYVCCVLCAHAVLCVMFTKVVYKGHRNTCKTLQVSATAITAQSFPSFAQTQILMIVCLFICLFEKLFQAYILIPFNKIWMRKSGRRSSSGHEKSWAIKWWLKLVVQQKRFELNGIFEIHLCNSLKSRG